MFLHRANGWKICFTISFLLGSLFNSYCGDVVVTLTKGDQPLSGERLFAFDNNGEGYGKPVTTDSEGKALFDIPEGKTVKFRVNYNSEFHWSDSVVSPAVVKFQVPQDTILTLTQLNEPLINVPVKILSADGTFLKMGHTDASGKVVFNVPEGTEVKFSFSYKGEKFETEVISSESEFHFDTINKPPVTQGDTINTLEDNPVPVVLKATDANNDVLRYTITQNPTKGVLSGTAPNLTYTPNLNANGQDSFSFKATDWMFDSNISTVTINITAVNDIPIADDKTAETDEDNAVAVTLTGSDVDGDELTFAIVTNPQNGTLSGELPNQVYTPNADFNGEETFTYKAHDSQADSAVATVTITVKPINDAPKADAIALDVNEDGTLAIVLTGSDVDGDIITFSLVSQPTNGSLTGTAPNLNYAPNANYNGEDSFRFKVNDGNLDSEEAQITINVSAVNDAPEADPQDLTTQAGPLQIVLTGRDVDGDVLTFTVITQPTNGEITGTAPNLTYTPNAGFAGDDSFTFVVNDGTGDSTAATIAITVEGNPVPIANPQSLNLLEDSAKAIVLTGQGNGLTFIVTQQPARGTLSGTAPNLTYTPNPDYNGQDSFSFKVVSGDEESESAVISLDIQPVNDAPTIPETLNVAVVLDNAKSFYVTGSDIDEDDLTYQITTQPTVGTATISANQVTYTPPVGFQGEDTLVVTVSDGNLTATTTVTLTTGPGMIITVTAPTPFETITSSSIRVTGTVQGFGATIDSFRINSELIVLDPGTIYNFDRTITLVDGVHNIVLWAASNEGHETVEVVPVVVDAVGTNVTILYPATNETVDQQNALVEVITDEIATVWVNGTVATADGYYHRIWINLAEGGNAVNVSLSETGETVDSTTVSFTARPGYDPLGDDDGDGVANAIDLFPNDPTEWADRDNDGTGDNSDGMPDDPTTDSLIKITEPADGTVIHAN